MNKIIRSSSFAFTVSVLTGFCVSAAYADVFDDARQTFQKDIPHFFQSDVPHFFQDDIPCAFGGQPTSHTKTSCKGAQTSVRHPPESGAGQPTLPSNTDGQARQAPTYDQ